MGRSFKVLSSLSLLLSMGFFFFNTTKILKERENGYVHDDFWNQSSLLYNTKYQEKSNWNLNQFVFGKNKNKQRESYNHFLAIQSQYETQKNFGMVDAYTEQMYYLEMTSLSKSTFYLVQQNQAENIRVVLGASAIKEYLQNPDYTFLKTPAAIVGALAAFYTGKLVHFRVSGDWSLSIQGSEKNEMKLGLIRMSTSGFSGEMTKDENNRYTLLLNKRFFDATVANVSYTQSTNEANIGVTQGITAGFNVQYDRTVTGVDKNKESVRLNYSAGF